MTEPRKRPTLRLVADDERPVSAEVEREDSSSVESALVERHDPGSFVDAFRRHYRMVHRMLRQLGVDDAVLDDATQDVFLVVHRRWRDYDGRSAFRYWLLGITRRLASDYRRAARRLRARLDRARIEVPPTRPGRHSDPDPELQLGDRQAIALVDEFLVTLDDDRREVFVLADIEGLSAPEIAEALGVKLNTVYSRLRVARQRFEVFLRRQQSRERGSHGRAR